MIKKAQNKSFIPKGVSWFAMPSEITLSSELDPYQYRLLAVLLNRDNLFQSTKNLDRYRCSVDWLVSHSGIGKTKVKKTLNELEEMGFITIARNGSKHRENTFHVEWGFIATYRRPRTQQELEIEGDATIEEDTTIVENTSQKVKQQPRYKHYLPGALASQYDPYYIRMMSPERRKKLGMPIPLPTPPLPAKEWYNTSGRQFVRDTYFAELLSLEQSGKDENELAKYVYTEMLRWVLPCVQEEDDVYVWKQVIKPDFLEYKRECASNENI